MLAEIIAIGDELTSGERLDTNSQWLSQELTRMGVSVRWHTAVGDQLDLLVAVFRVAFTRADCVVATGGLGPTADDLTRQALAEAAGLALEVDPRQLERIEALFRRRGREMPLRNRIQAELPAGARAIDNPHGSAPGIDLTFAGGGGKATRLFALPGVPAEMKEMYRDTVQLALGRMLGSDARTIAHYAIKCFGVGESDLEGMLPDLIRRGRDPQVGITVSRATITLRLTAEGRDPRDCREKMIPTIELIHHSLGDLVFGENDDELQHAVVRLLRQRGKSLAVAECGSGGMLSDWLSEADPAGESYRGGVVLRHAEAAAQWDLPAAHVGDASSQQRRAAAMARRVREWLAADIGLALGDFPADVDTAEAPRYVGLAVDSRETAVARALPFAGHPDVRGPRAAKQALDLLRKHLLGVERQ